MPQSVWWISITSRVPSRRWETASERITSSVMTPPALRRTCASPSPRPSAAKTSSRESMQVTIASLRLGRTSRCLAGSEAAKSRFAASSSSTTLIGAHPTGPSDRSAEQLVEAQRGAAGEEDVAVAVQEAGGGEVAHRPLDRVALGEVLGLSRTSRSSSSTVTWTGGGRAAGAARPPRGRVVLGGAPDVVHVFHGSTCTRADSRQSLPLGLVLPPGSSSSSSRIAQAHSASSVASVEVLGRPSHLLLLDQLQAPHSTSTRTW